MSGSHKEDKAMANKIEDGGSAYPFNEKHDDGSHYYSAPGMSLRDWFAGQALSGYLAHQEGWDTKSEIVARDCYALADAMIAARGAK